MFRDVPIVEIDDCLVVGMPPELTDDSASELQATLNERVPAAGARGVILDVGAVPAIDGEFARLVDGIGVSVRDLGAACVLVDSRPAAAGMNDQIGVGFDAVDAARSLAEAFERITSMPHSS